MFSTLIKLLLIFSGLSPSLLVLGILNIYQIRNTLSMYLDLRNINCFLQGFIQFVSLHHFIFLFLFFVILSKVLVNIAIKRLPIGRIIPKSIKPSDNNLISTLSTFIIPFLKLTGLNDNFFLIGFLGIAIIYCWLMKESYHFNIVLKLFYRYNNYEIQTTGEVTYMVLSRQILIHKKDLVNYVQLGDHMLINVTK
jgi:hypothetical protein